MQLELIFRIVKRVLINLFVAHEFNDPPINSGDVLQWNEAFLEKNIDPKKFTAKELCVVVVAVVVAVVVKRLNKSKQKFFQGKKHVCMDVIHVLRFRFES